MTAEGEACEKSASYIIKSLEIATNLTYETAAFFASLIESTLKKGQTNKDYERFNDIVKSQSTIIIYPISKYDIAPFSTSAIGYGISFCILKDKEETRDAYPLLIKKEDKNLVNRIFEKEKFYEPASPFARGEEDGTQMEASEKNLLPKSVKEETKDRKTSDMELITDRESVRIKMEEIRKARKEFSEKLAKLRNQSEKAAEERQ